jgi:deazaflavin-dependent oxidoreductase (nitroreductase family)
VSRLADLYARISPALAHRPGAVSASKLHARVLALTRGRLGGRLLGVRVLVLRTTGRRSGKERQTPLFFVTHGAGYAVVASNAASKRFPSWWLNMQAGGEAAVFVQGRWRLVHGRQAQEQEAAQLWPRFVATYAGYDHYKSIATRDLPVVVLEPLPANP